jgi:regulator of protease activity HflC (stomatin/prohibitin superfamily)
MVGTMLPWLSVVLPTLLGAFGGFQFVREGERAILLRFNKAVMKDGQYVVVRPGIKLVIPFADKLARMHVRHRTISLPPQVVRLANNEVFQVGVVILCEVKDSAEDLYNALFQTTDIDRALIDYSQTVVQSTIAGRSVNDLTERLDEITQLLCENLQVQANEWGMYIISTRLVECTPTQTTQLLDAVRETLDGVVKPVLTALSQPATQPDTGNHNGHRITTADHNGTGR